MAELGGFAEVHPTSSAVIATMSLRFVSRKKVLTMAHILFVEYPKCSTCKKAKAWLEAQGIEFEGRHIVEDSPSAEELRAWREAADLPVRRLFNTSGMLYRELNVKAQLDAGMTDEEAYELLASNGMLVKRPLLIVDGVPAMPGFKEALWAEALGL